MELDKKLLSMQPALETEGLHFLHIPVSPPHPPTSPYGWDITHWRCSAASFSLWCFRSFPPSRGPWGRGNRTAVEPDVVVKGQEALAAACFKMQEELNAQGEKYKEKLRQLEEEQQQKKETALEMWDCMQEGKGMMEM